MAEKKSKTRLRIAVETFGVMFLPVTSVVLGSAELDMCPVEENIPIGLIALGAITCLQGLLLVLPWIEGYKPALVCMHIVLGIAMIAALLAESVFVYPNFRKYDTSLYNSYNYCERGLYQLAFWYSTLLWSLLILMVCAICKAYLFCPAQKVNNSNSS